MHIAEIKGAVLLHHYVDVLIELGVVDPSAHNAECEDGRFHLECVMGRECENRTAQRRAVAVAEASHHAEVEPDNRAVSHADVAGVRIAVKEAVFNDLLGIVLAEAAPNLRDVDACRVERVGLVERDAVDVLHDEDVLRREVTQDMWA